MAQDAFVYATDLHLTDRQPSNRVTSVENGIEVFRNLLELTRSNGRVLILGGDLFDTPNPSYRLLTNVIQCLAEYSDCKVFICIGNHDISYANLDTPVGITALNAAGLLGFFDSGISINGFYFKAFNYVIHPETDKSGNVILRVNTGLTENEKTNTYVAVAHLPIVTKPVQYKHVLTQQIVTDADYVLCGHVHETFQDVVKQKDGTVTAFLNPGCLFRIKRNEVKITPSAIVFEKDMGVVSYRFVEVHGDDNPEFLQDAEDSELRFSSAVTEAKIEVTDIESYISKSEFKQEVKDKALELITKYKEI